MKPYLVNSISVPSRSRLPVLLFALSREVCNESTLTAPILHVRAVKFLRNAGTAPPCEWEIKKSPMSPPCHGVKKKSTLPLEKGMSWLANRAGLKAKLSKMTPDRSA
jgi:hypothetical protein